MPSSLVAPDRVRATPRAAHHPNRPWDPAPTSSYRAPRGTTALAFGVLALIAGGALAVGQLTDVPASADATDLVAAPSPGSMPALAEQLDVVAAWDAGITGAGVNVAVVDTGVAPVDALNDRVVVAVDFTDEAADRDRGTLDSYGHGTHVAGIVAGNDPSNGFRGLAPDAGLVSIKVAGADGTVRPQALVDGIDWAVENADEYGIGVLTLAFTADEATPAEADALLAAVDRAWDAGIVVVTAAGNHGDVGLYAPATSPSAIVVGAVEATESGLVSADFSNAGDAVRMPDLAAPGAHIESLRAPGSFADREHPEGFVDEHRFLATGTSQSAAAVSGLAALLLQADPDLSPDEVRTALVASADQVGSPAVTGAGVPSAARALDAVTADLPWSSGSWSSGSWSNDAWSSGSWSSGSWSSGSWSSGSWSNDAWSSGSWSSGSWSSGSWSSGSWSSGSWSNDAWSSGSWSSGSWSSGSWSSGSWSSGSWSSGSWSSGSWSSGSWSSGSWSSGSWSSGSWS